MLRAGVVPLLKEQKRITVLPMARVSGNLSPGAAAVSNIYAYNLLVTVLGAAAEPAVLATHALVDGLAPLLEPAPDETRIRPRLLIVDQFEAVVVWMSDEPMLPGRPYWLKIGTKQVSATITEPKYKVNGNTLEHLAAKKLELNEVGVCNVSLDQSIAFDPYQQCRETGSFILIDRLTNAMVGAGMIPFALRRSQNIHWQALDVNKKSRAALKGQQPAVLWLTGLSGAGKSTIANLVEKRLLALGKHTYLLDGDNVRHGLNRDLGFTDTDRVENIRRVAEVARLMAGAGLIVLVSFISPFTNERRLAREVAGDFYDCFELDGGKLGLVVADVSDKGAPAALFMAVARSLIRGTALTAATPEEALQRANLTILTDTRSGMFVTVYYAIIEPGGKLTGVNAGHNRPLVYRARSGEHEFLPRGGRPLGWFEALPVHAVPIQLEPGDILVFYTDGLTEAENVRREPYGDNRLVETVRGAATRPAGGVMEAITHSVKYFMGAAPPFDDMTVVVLRYTGEA